MASNHLVGPFLGINNRLPDNQLVHTERGVRLGNFLRNAVNVDLTDRGSIKRRQGATLAQAGGGCHSLWSDGRTGYYVDDGVLYQYPRVKLAENLINRRASFADAAGTVVWTDGATINKISDGLSLPLTQAAPNPLPSVSVSSTGALARGAYLVAFVAVGASGQSPPSWPVQVEVPDKGRLVVSGAANTTRVFMSGPNGEELFYCGDGNVSIGLVSQGGMLTTRGLLPMPPGNIVRYNKGRLLVAAGDTLFYSQPYAPGMYAPARGYLPFPDIISMIAPVQQGVFVSAGKTYFLSGDDIEKCEVIEKLPYPAVFGTDVRSGQDESVWWYSSHGVVNGAANGGVENVQERNVVPTQASEGASLYREQDGVRQLISSLPRSDFSRAAASSFIDAEIIRKERM